MGREDFRGTESIFQQGTFSPEALVCLYTEISAWYNDPGFHMQSCASPQDRAPLAPPCTKPPPAGNTMMSTCKAAMMSVQCQKHDRCCTDICIKPFGGSSTDVLCHFWMQGRGCRRSGRIFAIWGQLVCNPQNLCSLDPQPSPSDQPARGKAAAESKQRGCGGWGWNLW